IQDANIFNLTVADIDTSALRGTYGLNFFTPDTNLPTSLEFNFEEKEAGLFANLYVQIDGVLCFMENARLDENGTVVLPNVTAMGNYAVMLCEYSDRPGDVNNDGIINAKDSLAILKQFLGMETLTNSAVADFNGDGFVNSKDSLEILKKYLGME
ncbi:MAG: dockerin type I repeat-containing protein, partial [[Eubacterium] saphenum]|nr:dockerin type I repeat-containing protein [[Eubacterium] saphenum]